MIQCPNCHSYLVKTKRRKARLYTVFLMSSIGFSLLYTCNGSFIVVLTAIPIFLAAFLYLVAIVLRLKTRAHCNDCCTDFEYQE
jgi:hypothetical protein